MATKNHPTNPTEHELALTIDRINGLVTQREVEQASEDRLSTILMAARATESLLNDIVAGVPDRPKPQREPDPEHGVSIVLNDDERGFAQLASGIHGIVSAMNGRLFDTLPEDGQNLVCALHKLTTTLVHCTYAVPIHVSTAFEKWAENGYSDDGDDDGQRDECIRLQAERVVKAYDAFRNEADAAKPSSDDFPVGALAELILQCKSLKGWFSESGR